MRAFAAATLATAFLLGTAGARAQETSAEAQGASLYQEGIRHYDVAEYDAAIRAFKQAYLVAPAPELVYDIAQSYRLKGPGSCANAAQFYRSYLRLAPSTPKRAAVEAAIGDMDRCARTETPAADPNAEVTAPSPPKPPEPARPSEPPAAPTRDADGGSRHWLPVVVAGTGVAAAAAVTGVALLIASRATYDSIRDSGCAPACDSARVDGPKRMQTIGAALSVAGGAVAVAGFVWWLVARADASSHGAAAAVTPWDRFDGRVRF